VPTPAPFASVEEESVQRKQKLAGALRLFGRFGFSEGVAGHIRKRCTARDHTASPGAVWFSFQPVWDEISRSGPRLFDESAVPPRCFTWMLPINPSSSKRRVANSGVGREQQQRLQLIRLSH
jgi:hypothetical protein